MWMEEAMERCGVMGITSANQHCIGNVWFANDYDSASLADHAQSEPARLPERRAQPGGCHGSGPKRHSWYIEKIQKNNVE
jgi:hypothetical protein